MAYPKIVFLALGATAFASVASAQQSITSYFGYYLQDFDTLASTGAGNLASTLPADWSIISGISSTTYTADDGTITGPGHYSYGSVANSERALGSISEGDTRYLGAYFANNTGQTITELSIAYTGEMWHQGVAGLDTLLFEYSLDSGGALASGNWGPVESLDFTSPNNTGTGSAHDGNLPADQTRKDFVITGLSIASGSNFQIRWRDAANQFPSGAGDGLAIDNFAMAVPEPATVGAAVFIGVLALGGWYRRQRAQA